MDDDSGSSFLSFCSFIIVPYNRRMRRRYIINWQACGRSVGRPACWKTHTQKRVCCVSLSSMCVMQQQQQQQQQKSQDMCHESKVKCRRGEKRSNETRKKITEFFRLRGGNSYFLFLSNERRRRRNIKAKKGLTYMLYSSTAFTSSTWTEFEFHRLSTARNSEIFRIAPHTTRDAMRRTAATFQTV